MFSFDTRLPDYSCYICIPDAFPIAQKIYSGTVTDSTSMLPLGSSNLWFFLINSRSLWELFLSIPVILKSDSHRKWLYTMFAYISRLVQAANIKITLDWMAYEQKCIFHNPGGRKYQMRVPAESVSLFQYMNFGRTQTVHSLWSPKHFSKQCCIIVITQWYSCL